MVKYAFIFLLLCSFSFLSACGVDLQENEAATIINEHFNFPKKLFIKIEGIAKSAVGQGIKEIINTKDYVLLSQDNHGILTYTPTEKGKELVNVIHHSPFYSENYIFEGAIVTESLDSIKEILLDKESKTATVIFKTRLEPIEPFYSLICVDKKCSYFEKLNSSQTEKRIKLKNYDKGWRVYE